MAVVLGADKLPRHIWCCSFDDSKEAKTRRRLARKWEKRQWKQEVLEALDDGGE